jgi:GT2 family glycosyltransferase
MTKASTEDSLGPEGLAPEATQPLVTTIVVNFNQCDLLARCIRSLLNSAAELRDPMQIIVVDNASTDGSVEMVGTSFPQVDLLEMDTNVGFAAAIEQARCTARGEWLFLLNNDATLTPGALPRLLAVARAGGPKLGAVAGQIRFASNPSVIDSCGIEVDRLGVAAGRHSGVDQADGDQEPTLIFGPCGGAALLRTQMVEELGGFDKRYFMYLEDADLAWRAQVAGWLTYSAPEAIVLHNHAASAGHRSDFQLYHVGLNRIRLLAKNAPWSLILRYGLFMVFYDVGYITYVALNYRTFSPLRGRIAGIRQWRQFRDARIRDARVLVPVRGANAALRRNRAVSAHAAPKVRDAAVTTEKGD